MIAKYQQILVYPHGHPEQSAIGKVILISQNQKSIAIAFAEKPPFVRLMDGAFIHPEYGIVMLASNYGIGPWVEVTNYGHYEIDAIKEA